MDDRIKKLTFALSFAASEIMGKCGCDSCEAAAKEIRAHIAALRAGRVTVNEGGENG